MYLRIYLTLSYNYLPRDEEPRHHMPIQVWKHVVAKSRQTEAKTSSQRMEYETFSDAYSDIPMHWTL